MTDTATTPTLETKAEPEEPDLLQRGEVAPKPAKTEAKEYPCPHCGKIYARGLDRVRQMNLSNHIKYHHRGEVPPKKLGRPAKAKSAAAKVADEKPPKKRKPAGENIASLVSGGAQLAAKAGHVPLGNCLEFESAAAGEAIDAAIAGSWPDRHLVQPLVGGLDKWEAVGAVLALPVMVHLVTVYPGLAGPLSDPMRRAAEEVLVLSVPTIRKKVERQRKVTEALAELGALDPAIAEDPDPIASIINGFFVQPEETANAPATV